MGIAGLLPLLKKASSNSHVRKFSGCTAAIDAYGWLHKGAFGCAEKLGKGEPTTAYISYCMKYIQILLDNNVKPILVLDGRNLPSKEHTEKKRREKRDENRKLARKYLQEGKKKEAWECFTRCVDITPAMAREFIKVLRSMHIDYVIAPYEADAQLAYLAKTGVADIIITEDSDLVLFGCPKIFFKMNVNGDGVLFDNAKLPQCFGLTQKTFNFDHFRWMCILSGCDYLPSLPGIGLGRAKKVIQAANHESIEKMIESIPSVLDKVSVEITVDYIDGFIQADNTFLYQLVFDTATRRLISLNPYPENVDPNDMTYAGSYEHQKMASDLALGNVDIKTLKTVDQFDPNISGYTNSSIWSKSFDAGERKRNFVKTEPSKLAMELSISKKASPKKKRPFAVARPLTEENALDDTDLMNMYGERSDSVLTEHSKKSPDLVDDLEKDVKIEPIDSPVSNKRRRVGERKEEEHLNSSPSRNTRSRSSKVPFLKSKVKVESKYFKPTKTENDSSADSASDAENEDFGISPASSHTKLNIYSYENTSQDSLFSDVSASSQVIIESQNSQITTYECKKTDSDTTTASTSVTLPEKQPFVALRKLSISSLQPAPKVEEITLDDDQIEEDEAYGSSHSSSSLYSLRSTPSRTTLNSTSTRSPYFCGSPAVRSTVTRASVKTTPCRRVGLSRTGSGKKDPKQLSVKDMFLKKQKV